MGTTIQTAMIIDDDEDLSQLLAVILEKRKIHTMTVNSLNEAEEYLGYMKPTVIFLDNNFPEGLGVNFIQSIKSADEEIKIIMMTGDPASWIEEKAREKGINYFLKKPFTKHIVEGVLDYLNIKRE